MRDRLLLPLLLIEFSCISLIASAIAEAQGLPKLLRPFKSTYYVDKVEGLNVSDPSEPTRILGKLPNGAAIKDSFLLNSEGQPFELDADKEQLPYIGHDGRPYLGIKYKNQVAAIPADDLSKFRPPSSGKIPPELLVQEAPVASNKGTPVGAQVIQQAKKIVTEFHNQSCGQIQKTKPADMAIQIASLKKEWSLFIKNRIEKIKARIKNKTELAEVAFQLNMARNLDLVARTILYEADIVGLREGFVQGRTTLDNKVAYEKCTSIESCPISACERDIMTLTIRNRGLARRECASPDSRRKLEKRNPDACKYYGDFAYRATNPAQYNIWDPRWTSKYITTCFLKNGLDEKSKLDENKSALPDNTNWLLKRSIRQFELTLDTAARVLYGEDRELQNYFNFETNVDPANSALMQNTKHYVHPFGMPLCAFANFDKRISLRAAYAEKINDNKKQSFTLLIDEVLVAEGLIFGPILREQDANQFRRVYLNDNETWIVNADEIKDLPSGNSTNLCAPMGLSYLKDKDLNSCDETTMKRIPNYQDTWREQSRLVPLWATTRQVKQPIVGCNIPFAQSVEIGHKCDPRFQHYAAVDPASTGLIKNLLTPYRTITQPLTLSIAGYAVYLEKTTDDGLELVSKKGSTLISTLALAEDSPFIQIIHFRKISSHQNLLAIDFESTMTSNFEQKTCAQRASVFIDDRGELSLVQKKTYRCEIVSTSARETEKSFNHKYKLDDQ